PAKVKHTMSTPTASLPTATELRDHLTQQEAWLTQACGSALPQADDALLERTAGQLAAWRKAGRVTRITPGEGWDQGISPHLLPALAAAYQQTADDGYAEYARSLYEAVMNIEPWHRGWQATGIN